MMNSKLKKSILAVCCASALVACSVALVACGDDDKDNNKAQSGERSALIGGFENSESVNVAFTNDAELLGEENGNSEPYIYTSDVYPLNTIDGNSIGGIRYNIYQKLRLKRDYSYEYTLEIMVRMVGDSNINLCKLEASTKGTFTYTQNDGENYTVKVSDPTSGSEKRYGAYITGENNIFSWKMSSTANYIVDVERVLKQGKTDDGESLFDRYIKGRTVVVEKDGTERVLYNDVFYVDFMNDIAPYCSYDSSSVPKEEKPDVPKPPEPPAPSETSSGVTLPYVQKSGCDVALRFGDKNYIVVKTSDKTVTSATLDGVVVTGKSVEGETEFEFPISYDKLGDTLDGTVGGASFTFKPIDYLNDLYPQTVVGTSDMATASVVANLINVAAEFGADGATLTSAMQGQIFGAGQSVHQGAAWDKRDNMDIADTADKTADFDWVSGALGRSKTAGLAIENGIPTLAYMFKLNENSHGKITANVKVGGVLTENVQITQQMFNGENVNVVKVPVQAPSAFDDAISVEVYDSGKKMSVATYSATRAFAAAYLQNGTELKTQSDALWSLGKSVAWYAEKDGAPYAYNFSNGSYSFTLGEYGYSTAATNPDYGFLFGSRIYVGGKIVDDNSGEVGDEGNTFTASRGAAVGGKYPFAVGLDGANIDGISIADTDGSHGSITVTVNSDSTLGSMLLFNNNYGTINANCDVVIKGTKGATLTVIGTVYTTGKLTVDGVTVKVVTYGPYDGVTCGDLEITNGGGLKVEYAGKELNTKYGVKLGGSAQIDGTFESKGFDSGVCLADATAEQTFTVNGGSVVIDALRYGINEIDVFDDPSASVNHYLSRELIFNGGVTNVKVGEDGVCGASLCNITLNNDAELYIDVAHGVGILGKYEDFWTEWTGYVQHSSLPTKIKTNSGSESVGALSIIVRGGGIIATVDEMLLDGGNIYLYAESNHGFIKTAHGAVITASNCDLTFENGNDLKTSYGRAIQAENGDEVITVEDTSKAVFKNCDTAIECWSAESGAFAKLINNGLIIIDTYKLDVEPPPWDNWNLQLQVENNGQIRRTNQL